MEHAKLSNRRPLKLTAPMSLDEYEEVYRFLKKTGRKIGPWVRVLIVDAIKKEEEVRK